MGGKHVGETADFAPAHGVRLAGQREGAHAGAADAAGRQMAVEDGIDLVGAGRGLVDALAVAGHHLRGRLEQTEEFPDLHGRQAGPLEEIVDIKCCGGRKGAGEALRMGGDIILVDRRACRKMREQPHEQRDIAVRADGQMQVGDIACHRPARIDDDDAHVRPRRFCGGQPLVDDGMAPGEVGAGEHHEVREFDILIGPGHGIGAEGAAMPGHRRGHAEPGIGVDIGRTDEALHQLVGEVIILGQQLAGDVEGDGIRSVLGDRFGKTSGDQIERLVPAAARACDFGIKKPAVEIDGFGKRRTFRAEPAEIRRMLGISLDADGAGFVDRGDNAAADAAIGAGGLDLSRHYSAAINRLSSAMKRAPSSLRTGMVRTAPSSAPSALPVSSEITQLCSGQVTALACTMPWESGAALVRGSDPRW